MAPPTGPLRERYEAPTFMFIGRPSHWNDAGNRPLGCRNGASNRAFEGAIRSPQFHVKQDPTFNTVREEKQDTPAQWMVKAGFVGVRKDSSDRGSKRPAKGGKSQAGKQKTAKNGRQQEGEELSHGNGARKAPPGNDAERAPSWLTLPPTPPHTTTIPKPVRRYERGVRKYERGNE
jgi:hypothetical protein